MTLKEFFDATVTSLSSVYDGAEAKAVAFALLEELSGVRRWDVALCGGEPFSPSPAVEAAVAKLITHCPLQYVLGYAWFRGRKFAVDESVLIPRPETEELVEWIVEENALPGPRIIDIGTGSGAIAVSLALEIPGSEVSAVDISPAAVTIATGNATENGVKVEFSLCDILSQSPRGEWDIIVSNPPYITDSEKHTMRENVIAYEPHCALFVDDGDPLLFYRTIAGYARKSLAAGGRLYFEINERFGRETVGLLESTGFSEVVLRRDIFERERIVRAVWR